MSEPTVTERILTALESNQAALDALLASHTDGGDWAARGPLYLAGHPIRGGHPDDPSIDTTVRIEGGVVEIIPDPATGGVRMLGAKTPQLKRTLLDGSLSLSADHDGTLFVSMSSDEDPDITLTLPAFSGAYEENGEAITEGSLFVVQVFHAGSGVVKFAVSGSNVFLLSGASSTDPVVMDPGTAAVCMYLGDGAWGVF